MMYKKGMRICLICGALLKYVVVFAFSAQDIDLSGNLFLMMFINDHDHDSDTQ